MTALDDALSFDLPTGVGNARPVFVVGAPRSGASLLTLSLGQHPNLTPVLETNWFERLAVGLQHAYSAGISPRETSQLDAMGIDLAIFSAVFGDAIDRMMRELTDESHAPGQRWVDGSEGNALKLFAILRLFPRAKVIHVYREAGEVVATLSSTTNRRLYKTRYRQLPVNEALAAWNAAVVACVEAERAFGSRTVLRVQRSDLVEQPELALRRCLEFLGEPMHPACLRPFRTLDSEQPDAPETPRLAVGRERASVPRTTELLSRMLFEEGSPSYAPDDNRLFALEWAFGEQCRREEKLMRPIAAKLTMPKKASAPETAAPPLAESNVSVPGQASRLNRFLKRRVDGNGAS